MNLDTLIATLPEYAKDVKLNVSSLESITSLEKARTYGIALASAYATKHAVVIRAVRESAAAVLDDATMRAAAIAASLMAMNNVYYRFLHLVGDKEYARMPARLRMAGIASSGIDKLTFELFALAVSSLNGCGMCMDSHEKTLVRSGASREQVQDTIRIAAIVHSLAATLAIEEAIG